MEQKDLLIDEEKRMRRLGFVIDLAMAVLMQSNLTMREAFDLLRTTRQAALGLFPDKGEVYDLVYAPRFQRILRERFLVPGGLDPATR